MAQDWAIDYKMVGKEDTSKTNGILQSEIDETDSTCDQ